MHPSHSRPAQKYMDEHVRDQAEFLNTKLKSRLDDAQAGPGYIFFVDAAHFVFGTFLCCPVMKRRTLYGRYHPTFSNFRAAIQEVQDGLSTKYAEELATLMSFNFRQFEDVSLMGA
jgi:hypothetical protein